MFDISEPRLQHEENQRKELLTDGGRYTETAFTWYNPELDMYLFEMEVEGEFGDFLYESEDQAYGSLEQLSEESEHDLYESMVLKKAKMKQVGEALDVLTDQQELFDYNN